MQSIVISLTSLYVVKPLEGTSICFFPEGTSTDGLRVLKFKSGFFQLLFDKEQMLEDWLKLDVNGRIELRTRLAPYLLTKAKEEEFKPHPSRGIDFKKLVNAIAFKNTPEDDTTKLPS